MQLAGGVEQAPPLAMDKVKSSIQPNAAPAQPDHQN